MAQNKKFKKASLKSTNSSQLQFHNAKSMQNNHDSE